MSIKNYLYTLFLILALGACKKSDPMPTLLVVPTVDVDMGAISSTVSKELPINFSGKGVVTYTIASDKKWVKLDKTTGTASATEKVKISATVPSADLVTGDNVAVLTITPTIDGVVSAQQKIKIIGKYKATTALASANPLNFGTIKANATNELSLTKDGTETLTYTLKTDQAWISLDKTSGTLATTDKIKVSIDTKGFSYGQQEGNILLTQTVNGVVLPEVKIPVKAFFDNTISGDIAGHTLTKNETWSGIVNLGGDISIPIEYTLTILPGTIVNIKSGGSNFIQISTYGKFIANGTISKIIEFKSSQSDWRGIDVNGDVEISYAYFKNAKYGINYSSFISSSYFTKAPIIKNCFFDSGDIAIAISSRFETTFSNLTFRNVNFQGIQTFAISKLNIENTEFAKPDASDFMIFSNNLNINVKNSNFEEKSSTSFKHVEISSKNSNNTITAENCYNLKLFNGVDVNGNKVINNKPATAIIPNKGCGFTNKY